MPDDALRQHRTSVAVVIAKHLALITLMASVVRADAATKPSTRPSLQTPLAQAVVSFRNALRFNRVEQAAGMIATSKGEVRDADRRLKRLATALSSGGWDLIVIDAHEIGEAGVVVINNHLKDGRKTTDLVPWYLIKQDGKWKMLAKYTDFELEEYGFDEATLANFRKLEEWFEKREPQLRKEQPDCGC